MKLYICHSIYHLLITLLKSDHYSDVLIRFDLFDKSLFKKYIRKLYHNVFFEIKDINFKNYSDVYVFNDWNKDGNFLRSNKIYHHLIEDGYNYYSYNICHYYEKNLILKLKYYLRKFMNQLPWGRSKFVIDVEVNDLTTVHKNMHLCKMFEVKRSHLFSNIDELKQKWIAELFGLEDILNPESKKVLVLTQPIYHDKVDDKITTSKEQIEFYQNIVDEYVLDYEIVFKIHPRDKTEYPFLDLVKLLPNHIPMELYQYFLNYQFDIGITHSSSALEFLNCINKKIFLGELFNQKRG